jgi:hypothetical protein
MGGRGEGVRAVGCAGVGAGGRGRGVGWGLGVAGLRCMTQDRVTRDREPEREG